MSETFSEGNPAALRIMMKKTIPAFGVPEAPIDTSADVIAMVITYRERGIIIRDFVLKVDVFSVAWLCSCVCVRV